MSSVPKYLCFVIVILTVISRSIISAEFMRASGSVTPLILFQLDQLSQQFNAGNETLRLIEKDSSKTLSLWKTQKLQPFADSAKELSEDVDSTKTSYPTYDFSLCETYVKNVQGRLSNLHDDLRAFVSAHGAIINHYVRTFTQLETESRKKLNDLVKKAESCDNQTDLSVVFACLLGVFRDLLLMPNSEIALDRTIFAAQAFNQTLSMELMECPYDLAIQHFGEYIENMKKTVLDCLQDEIR